VFVAGRGLRMMLGVILHCSGSIRYIHITDRTYRLRVNGDLIQISPKRCAHLALLVMEPRADLKQLAAP
jgi:hypothetical protein